MPIPNPALFGARLMDPETTKLFTDLRSVSNGITALAGGTQAGSPLTNVFSRVTTVATAGDSVLLPVAVPGRVLFVINAAAANSMNVFPNTGDAINAIAANGAFAMAANKMAMFACAVAGTWNTNLTA